MPVRDKDRFEEIMGEVKDLVDEAAGLCTGTAAGQASSYWVPWIHGSIDNNTGCGPMCTMQDSLDDEADEDEGE